MILNEKMIKILGLTATVVGMGATLVSGWVADKKMDETIGKKVAEALTKKEI